jgi:Zn-dependent protease
LRNAPLPPNPQSAIINPQWRPKARKASSPATAAVDTFGMEQLLPGLAWYMAFLFSVTVHEASHAIAAWRLGDPTAYQGGQVTLDPVPHIRREPLGMVVVPLVSFFAGGWMIGWGSTPYDFVWALRHPRRSAWMSLAGPAANLVLVICSAVLIRIGLAAGLLQPPEAISFSQIAAAPDVPWLYGPTFFVSILFSLNLLLFFFNLIPLPPLDGAGLPLLFMRQSQAEKYHEFITNPAFSWVGLIVAWQVFGRIFAPLHPLAVNLLYSGVASYS